MIINVFRYLIVGVSLFLLDLTVFLLCVNVFGTGVTFGQVLSRSAGAFAGFFGHKYFSFKAWETKDSVGQLTKRGSGYVFVVIFNIGFSPVVVSVLVSAIPGNLILSKLLAEVFLVVETYILLKIVFTWRAEKVENEK